MAVVRGPKLGAGDAPGEAVGPEGRHAASGATSPATPSAPAPFRNARRPMTSVMRLREADDLPFVIDVDADRVRARGQARHGAHVAADRVHEAGAHRGSNLAHRKLPALRRSLKLRIRGDGQVRLRDTGAQHAETVAL